MSTETRQRITSLSEGVLRAKREAIAEKLYATKVDDPAHASLQSQFNIVERELFLRNGGEAKCWKDKQDVRHRFKFTEKSTVSGVIEQVAEMAPLVNGKGEHTLLPPDEVINWRNTKVGAKVDASLREGLNKSNRIDDAGHLIALFFGPDPGEPKNLAAQNCVQNQAGGTWHREESELRKELERGSISECKLRVVVRYTDDAKARRGFAWHMDASGRDASGKPRVFNGNIYHLNRVQHSGSRTDSFQQARELRERVKRLTYTEAPVFHVIKVR